MAAEVGIIQAATVALFYAFSANARSLILNQQAPLDAADVLYIRMLLLLPLSVTAFFLSTAVMQVELILVIVLIIRRAVEWLQEVRLSKEELMGNTKVAGHYVVYQSILLSSLTIWIVFWLPGLEILLLIWAVLPLAFDSKYIFQSLGHISSPLRALARRLMPHLGSSLIIGISVYAFRILIVLLTGKEVAGDLFTAFAIGGIFGSIFANAIGATIVFNEEKSGIKNFPWYINIGLFCFAIFGLVIFVVSSLDRYPSLLEFKSPFFHQALGLSMIGGVIMIFAQKFRFRLLHGDSEHDVFGPDILINIGLIASIPFAYFIFGKPVLTGLYFYSAFLALIFYMSTNK